jgi:putative holliday junction resolvase
VTDPRRAFVFPRDVIPRDAEGGDDILAIVALCREERATAIVVGLPLNVDGTEGPAAAAARSFGAAIGAAANLPVRFVDERYTSIEAEEALRVFVKDPRERKKRVDAAAATLILRTYLDHGPHV